MHIEEIVTQSHEKVLYCSDEASGLKSFIAIHNTTLGPALGGCRMWNYSTKQEALADVLRLSAGMTSKSAIAGLPFGGGKAVILGDSRTDKVPEKLRAFGRFVDTLQGNFITGEDVGMSPDDMAIVAKETPYITGLVAGPFGSGDPSPVTAEGVFRCMKLAAERKFGTTDLFNRTVAIQGLGHVGMSLAHKVRATGAAVFVADINQSATQRAQKELGANVLLPSEIIHAKADILAPCALGGVFYSETIPHVQASVICGAANNQLTTPRDAEALLARGILYCPDFVVNAGGLINVASEALKIEAKDWVEQRLRVAVSGFENLLERAEVAQRSPLSMADDLVAEILAEAQRGGPSIHRANGR